MTAELSEELTSDFDPMTPEFTAHQIEALEEVRGRCPVAHSTNWGGFWALLDRDDIVAAAKDHKHLTNSPQHIVPSGLAGNSRPLMHADQPEHTVFRSPIQDVLNSGELLEEVVVSVRNRAKEMIAALAAKGDGDLVRQYSGPLMGHTITAVFHIDEVTGDEFDSFVHGYVLAGQVRDAEKMQYFNRCMEDVAWNLLADRRVDPRDPRNDLASALVQAQTEGRITDETKMMGAMRQPFVVVWLATEHTLANMFRRLVTDRALQQRLRSEPELIAASVDEFLRMDQPQLGFARTAQADVEFGGRMIRAGEPVALVFPVANRDPKYFEDPDTFKIGRYPNPHLAFGAGIHSCPGKNIAKAVVEVALHELITGTGDLTLTIPESEIPNEHWPFRASLSLPVRVAPPAV